MTIATNSEKLMNTDAKAISKPGLREKRRVDWKERIFHGLFLTSAVMLKSRLSVWLMLFVLRLSC